MKPVLTTGDVADYCHVSLPTVYRWIKKGHIRAYTLPEGHHRVLLRDFRAFLEDHGMPIDEAFFHQEGRPRRILIVDDEPPVVQAITRALTRENGRFEVASTNDGFEAGMLVRSFRPHLVILDLMMPGLDGFQVCERICSDPQTADIKILVVTGYAEQENIERVLALGADDYLEKPLDTEELVAKVELLLGAGPRRGAGR